LEKSRRQRRSEENVNRISISETNWLFKEFGEDIRGNGGAEWTRLRTGLERFGGLWVKKGSGCGVGVGERLGFGFEFERSSFSTRRRWRMALELISLFTLFQFID
jgi:hypothetical protein